MSFIPEASSSYKPFQDVKYESLEDSDSESIPSQQPQSFHGIRRKIWPFLTGVGSALLAVALALLTIHILTPSAKSAEEIEKEDWNYCGRSSKVAMERGCVMEPLFYGWMPPQCVYRELSDKLPVFEDRKWYLDKNLTHEVPIDDLWAGKHNMIYTQRYHGEHCLFQWRKLQYAMDKRMDFLDNKTVSGHHTGHCADQLSVGCEGPHDRNEVELGFYRCRKTIW